MSQDSENRLQAVIKLLQEMDRQQQKTDEEGGREVAWFYFRNDIAAALGVDPVEAFPEIDFPPDVEWR